MIKSTAVRYKDFLSDEFRAIVVELGENFKIHRKLWEFVRIVQAVRDSGIELDGARVLGFGVGSEPIAAWFAAQGSKVMATDLVSNQWRHASNQNAQSKDQIRYKGVCSVEQFDTCIEFANVDMNHIPRHMQHEEYDIIYSAGSLEHIGSKAHSVKFLQVQMKCLKPGGLAVHTTEFAYDGTSVNYTGLCTFTADDFNTIRQSMIACGSEPLELDFTLGDHKNDLFVDTEPYGDEPHIRMNVGGIANITSFCLAIKKLTNEDDTAHVSDNSSKTVLWIGDAVTPTGFAKCTHAVCDELHNRGHRVSVLGMNYFGDPHPYPYPIYPCVQPFDGGRDPFGVTRLERMAQRLQPDAIVFLNDSWNIENYLENLSDGVKDRCKLIAWLAIDGANQKAVSLNGLDSVFVWTEFAANEIKAGGYNGPTHIIPLGVNSELFCSVNTAECREKMQLATVTGTRVKDDDYVVGVVGRNQYPRKRLDLSIYCFSKWIAQYSVDNAFLMLHCPPTGESGYDILSLAEYWNVKDRLILTEVTGSKDTGRHYAQQDLVTIYNCMDIYMNTGQGEGWGLPALETMACGVPVIAPDWSGLGDWAKGRAYLVPCSSIATSAPMNGKTYTIGGVVDNDLLVEGLQYTRESVDWRSCAKTEGRLLAQRLSWNNTSELFIKALESEL